MIVSVQASTFVAWVVGAFVVGYFANLLVRFVRKNK